MQTTATQGAQLTLFKDRPLEERKSLVKAMVARMAIAYGVKKSELPEVLGCSSGLINNWGYHGRIPYDYIEKCRAQTGISTDWLLYGVESVKSIMDTDITELSDVQAKVLADGLRYGMIAECYDGATKQLSDTFKADIDNWVKKIGAKQVSGQTDNRD